MWLIRCMGQSVGNRISRWTALSVGQGIPTPAFHLCKHLLCFGGALSCVEQEPVPRLTFVVANCCCRTPGSEATVSERSFFTLASQAFIQACRLSALL